MVRALSVIELLLAIVVLGLVAAISIPALTRAERPSLEHSLRDELVVLRTAIELYHQQHAAYPGATADDSSPNTETIRRQLTAYTDLAGATADRASERFAYGPYLTRIPACSADGSDQITIVAGDAMETASDATGWLFDPHTGYIRPASMRLDSLGVRFRDY